MNRRFVVLSVVVLVLCAALVAAQEKCPPHKKLYRCLIRTDTVFDHITVASDIELAPNSPCPGYEGALVESKLGSSLVAKDFRTMKQLYEKKSRNDFLTSTTTSKTALKLGYVFTKLDASKPMVPLYKCKITVHGPDVFDSLDEKCEGNRKLARWGYIYADDPPGCPKAPPPQVGPGPTPLVAPCSGTNINTGPSDDCVGKTQAACLASFDSDVSGGVPGSSGSPVAVIANCIWVRDQCNAGSTQCTTVAGGGGVCAGLQVTTCSSMPVSICANRFDQTTPGQFRQCVVSGSGCTTGGPACTAPNRDVTVLPEAPNPFGPFLAKPILVPPLVINDDVCDVLVRYPSTTGNNYWCSPQGQWIEDKKNFNERHKCSTPTIWGLSSDTEDLGCCPIGSCWNGTGEVENQILDSAYNPTINLPKPENNFRCVDGAWKDTPPKRTWDNAQLGYCPETFDANGQLLLGRCLVKPTNNNDNVNNNDKPEMYFKRGDEPACIKSDQYILDHFCDGDGNWTSRTKLLALNLLSIAESTSFAGQPYTLYCDKPQLMFDDVRPLARQGIPGKPGVCLGGPEGDTEVPCYNNFCLLRIGSVNVIGTTLNTQFESDPSFAGVIEERLSPLTCKDATGSTFVACDTPGLYYNREFGMALYLPRNQEISFGESQSINNALLSRKTGIIKRVKDVAPTSGSTRGGYEFLTQRNNFDIIYAARNGDRTLFGIIEQDVAAEPLKSRATKEKRDFIGVHYVGPQFDVCEFIKQRDPSAICRSERKGAALEITIAQQRIAGQESTIISAWRDLSARLRP